MMVETGAYPGEAPVFQALAKTLGALCAGDAAWAARLKGVEPAAVATRAALAKLPVLRKGELVDSQKTTPPLGGFNITPAGGMARLFVSPGPIFEAEGRGENWWGGAEALTAAGVKPGDIVLNTFSYHLTPAGFMFESGARALGCAVIPAGPAISDDLFAAIAHYRPGVFVGIPDFLKIVLDKLDAAGIDNPISRALVSGAALPPSLAAEFGRRGVSARQSYGTAELGLVAFEDGGEGMRVAPNVIVEIVKPGSGEPVAAGEVGEVVATLPRADYPLIRFATGDLSSLISSPDGPRISGWKGRADQAAKVKGMFVRPEQVNALAAEFPDAGRMRLVVTRENERDIMTLMVESADAGMAPKIGARLAEVTKLRGAVEIVPPGELPNDGKVIADERG